MVSSFLSHYERLTKTLVKGQHDQEWLLKAYPFKYYKLWFETVKLIIQFLWQVCHPNFAD